MKINFKTGGGATAQLDNVETNWTLAQVKEKLAPLLDLQPSSCRLIFKGRILKDSDTIESIKIQDGMSMHVVRTNVTPTPSESTAAAAAATSQGQTNTGGAAATTQPPASTTTNPSASTAPNATGTAPNPFANNPFLAGLGGMPGMGGMGGMPDMGGLPGMPGFNPQMLQQMLQNPMMQQMMQEMLRNPETLRNMLQANPMFQSLANSNPMVRETLNNPELLRTMLDPATLQAASQMYGGGQGAAAGMGGMPDLNSLLSQMGMGGAAPAPGATTTQASGAAAPAGGAATTTPPMPDFNALFGAMNRPAAGTTGPTGATAQQPNIMDAVNRMMQDPQLRNQMMNLINPGAGAAAPSAPDGTPLTAEEETRFADALRQLEDMGFTDRNSNAWALRSTGGEVNAAINMLLEYNFGN